MAEDSSWPSGHVGYVALLGRPNVGKSTLLNAMVDYRLAAVSSKPQTTRRRWLGARSDDDSQILFLDIPGVHAGENALDESMQHSIERAVADADLLVCIVDPTRVPGCEDQMVVDLAAAAAKPRLLVINKTDAASAEQVQQQLQFYTQQLQWQQQLCLAAVQPATLTPLIAAIKQLLPRGPFFYERDFVSTALEREIAADIVREAVLESLRDEVPHATAVDVEKWEETPAKIKLWAALYVERETQKQIVIGRGGEMIEQIRKMATNKLVDVLERRVQLRLHVKVVPHWRRNKGVLRQLDLLAN